MSSSPIVTGPHLSRVGGHDPRPTLRVSAITRRPAAVLDDELVPRPRPPGAATYAMQTNALRSSPHPRAVGVCRSSSCVLTLSGRSRRDATLMSPSADRSRVPVTELRHRLRVGNFAARRPNEPDEEVVSRSVPSLCQRSRSYALGPRGRDRSFPYLPGQTRPPRSGFARCRPAERGSTPEPYALAPAKLPGAPTARSKPRRGRDLAVDRAQRSRVPMAWAGGSGKLPHPPRPRPAIPAAAIAANRAEIRRPSSAPGHPTPIIATSNAWARTPRNRRLNDGMWRPVVSTPRAPALCGCVPWVSMRDAAS